MDPQASSEEQAGLDAALALSLRFSLSLGSLCSEEVNQAPEEVESEPRGLQLDMTDLSNAVVERAEVMIDGGSDEEEDIDAWELDMQWDEYADHKFGGEGDPGFFPKAAKRKSGGTGVGEEEEEKLRGKLSKKDRKGMEKENDSKGAGTRTEKRLYQKAKGVGGMSAKAGVTQVRHRGPKGPSKAPPMPATATRKGVARDVRGVLKLHSISPDVAASNSAGSDIARAAFKTHADTNSKNLKNAPLAGTAEEATQAAASLMPGQIPTYQSMNSSIPKTRGERKARHKTKETRSKSLDLLSRYEKLNACRYREAPGADSREERKKNRAWKGWAGLGEVAVGDEAE